MFIAKPKDFNYKSTIYSHGWYQLRPFDLDEENLHLKYICKENSQKVPVKVNILEVDKKLKLEFQDDDLPQVVKKSVKKKVEHILRIDEDLTELYEVLQEEKDLAWIVKISAGRLLRSATVFEDLIKTICTTNCSWALTKNMVTNLVEKLGEQTSTGERSFPDEIAMAEVDVKFYREQIRAGYRSEYFLELAESVAKGSIKPEDWLETNVPTEELKKEMKAVKGVGNYAAENLLKLVGRYDGLALDSFLRSEFYKKYNGGNKCEDKEIERFYERFGKWKGLVIWFDMSKSWLDLQK